MLFKIINDTQAQRHVWARGRQTLVPPGETKTLDLADNNAIFLRRCEKRGDLFRIEALDDAGFKVLQQAAVPYPPRNYPNRLGPDAAIVPGTGEIRDGIQEALLEEARIRELAKQPDPGMLKPVRVPRVE